MRYYFHIVGAERLQVDRAGQTFTEVANVEDHARYLAKDLSGSGLSGYTVVATNDRGDIVFRAGIIP